MTTFASALSSDCDDVAPMVLTALTVLGFSLVLAIIVFAFCKRDLLVAAFSQTTYRQKKIEKEARPLQLMARSVGAAREG